MRLVSGDCTRGVKQQLTRPTPIKPASSLTIADVAKAAGVSPMTVSRVFNQSERVSKATREKVETTIAELNFTPDPSARGL